MNFIELFTLCLALGCCAACNGHPLQEEEDIVEERQLCPTVMEEVEPRLVEGEVGPGRLVTDSPRLALAWRVLGRLCDTEHGPCGTQTAHLLSHCRSVVV